MASVEAYQTKAGQRLYRVRYRDEKNRPQKINGVRTKREADRIKTEMESQRYRGQMIDLSGAKTTVAELHPAWWHTKIATKPSWRARMAGAWRVHVEPEWGDRQIGSIKPSHVQAWVSELSESQSPSSVRTIVGVLQGILDIATKDRKIASNPAREVALPRSIGTEKKFLTAAQVARLAHEVSHHSEIVWTLAFTGLRWGELAALRPIDVDTAAHRIAVTRSASKRDASFDFVVPKTWERREVAVPASVMDRLLPVIEAAASPTTLIWARPDGTPLRPPTTTHWLIKAIWRLAKPLEDESGDLVRDEHGDLIPTTDFPIISAHDLRHTAASLMISSGASIKAVQRQLGHKSAAMTLDTYGHLYPDDLDALAKSMDGIARTTGIAGSTRAIVVPSEGSGATDET